MNKIKIKGIYFALLLSAASGLIYEVVATNLLFRYFIQSTYSVATVLGVFMFGLGLGSFLIHRFKDRIRSKENLFTILQLVIAFYSFGVLTNALSIIPKLNTLGIFAVSGLLLLLPTVCLGAIFPLSGIIAKKKNSIGLIYSCDLAGAVMGSLLAGFLLIPLLGNSFTLMLAACLNLLSATIMVKSWKKIIITLLILLVGFFMVKTHFDLQKFEPPEKPEIIKAIPLIIESKNVQLGKVQFVKNSPFGEVKIMDNTLTIDGVYQCNQQTYDQETYRSGPAMAGYSIIPFASRNINVLNVGLGCGFSVAKALELVDADIDVAEINPVVTEASRFFTNVADNERVNIIHDDGLNYLRKTDKTYDVIIFDLQHPALIHTSNLFTLEAFKSVKGKLSNGGIFSLIIWACGKKEALSVIVNTLKMVFENVYIMKDGYFFIASDRKLPYESPNLTATSTEINTIDRKILSWLCKDSRIEKSLYRDSFEPGK